MNFNTVNFSFPALWQAANGPIGQGRIGARLQTGVDRQANCRRQAGANFVRRDNRYLLV